MRILLTIIILCIANFLEAQDPVHRVFNNLNGLPSNSVYNILQDKKGFIWLSHDKGLSRFDGKQIINYKNPSAQSKSLSNLIEVNDTIWCQDFTGIYYKTNQKKELIATGFYTPGPFNSGGFVNNQIVSIKYDSIKIFNVATKITDGIALNNTYHTAVYFANKQAYFFDKNKIVCYNGLTYKEIFEIPKSKVVFTFLVQLKNKFYAVSKNSFPYIHELSNNTIKSFNYLPQGCFIQDVCVINNEIWFCTSSGAYCYDENFIPKYGGKCFFKNNSVSKVIQDKEGSYWFSTINNGVYIVPNINAILYNFNNESFTAVTSKNNNLLIGTNTNSIISFNSQNFTFNPLFKQPNNHEVLNIVYDSIKGKTYVSSTQLTSFHNGIVKSIIQLASKSVTKISNNLLVVAYASGIGIINTNQPLQLIDIPKWLQTKSGILDNNVFKLNINTGRCRDVLYDEGTQTLYAATANGLLYFSPHGNGEVKMNGKTIYASSITSLNNVIFVGTFVQNVIAITKYKATTQLNVSTNAIYKLHAFGNQLFAIADDGLIQYNLITQKKQQFTSADGLPKAELKDILVKNNVLYVATSLGLVKININDKKVNTVPPVIELNEVNVNGNDSVFKQNISLDHNQNNITINFSALTYKSNDKVKVKYKINDKDWITIDDDSRTLNLPSLSPSNYSISVKAINEDGIESTDNLQLNFTINNPFYKQWWFICAIVVLLFLLLLGYFRKTLHQQQLKNNLLAQKIKLEQDLQQSMMASIKSQMNPHFLFNALNTIQSYIYTNDKENASQYLGKFSTLTRMILDMSNKEIVALSEEIKAINLYLELEKLRFEDKLLYHFSIDNNISIETTFIPSMIIQPFIENAIKHGLLHKKNDWLLNITFNKKDNQLVVCIDDNGIGRKRSEELNKHKSKHQSFASNANQKRLAILNKGLPQSIALEIVDKTDVHGNALGTSVIMQIPFSKK